MNKSLITYLKKTKLIYALFLMLFFSSYSLQSYAKDKMENSDSSILKNSQKEKNQKKKLVDKGYDSRVYVNLMPLLPKLDKEKVLRVVDHAYVTNYQGAKKYFRPQPWAELPDKLPFPHLKGWKRLYELKGLDNWYVVETSVRGKIIIDRTLYVFSTNTVWVYVKKSDFEIKENIKLKEEALSVVDYWNDLTKREYHPNTSDTLLKIDSLMKISLVSKEYFESFKNKQIRYIKGKNKHKKKRGILRLPIKEKPHYIEFKDWDGECGGGSYDYEGEIPFLKAYLIGLAGCEEYIVKLVDKNSGQEISIFDDYPFISPGKITLVSIGANPYSTQGRMGIYRIKNNQIKQLHTLNFLTWMPADYSPDLLWIDDQTFMLAVNHPINFWKANGSLNDKSEYIKIKLLDKMER